MVKIIKDKNQKFEMNLKITFEVDRLDKVQKAEELLMEYGNISQIIDFITKVPNADENKLVNQIIKNISNGKVKPEELGDITECVINNQNINPENMEKMVLSFIKNGLITKDNFKYVCYLANNVKGMNIDKIEDEIIKMDSEVYMIWFSKNVKNANQVKFKKAFEKKEKAK